jgi:hypothetical protein
MAGRVTRIEYDHDKKIFTVTKFVCEGQAVYTTADVWPVIQLLQNLICEIGGGIR